MEPIPTMPIAVPIVERAFQLAGSGEFYRIKHIASHLRKEGYLDVEEHLLGCPSLRKQLRDAIQRNGQTKD
jgi:hypothetical protein